MPLALLTGRQERVYDLAMALKAIGFEIHEEPEEPGLAAGTVHCYAQFADAVPSRGDDPAGWARAVLTGTTLARLEDAVRFGDLLADSSRVLLITEPPADGMPPPDLALVRVLIEAILDRPGRRVQVMTLDGVRTAPDLAAFARSVPDWTQYAEVEPDLDYVDWRNAVMALTTDR